MWSIWVADRTLPYVEGPCKERRSVLNAKRTIWNKRHLCQSGANICRENVDDPPRQVQRDEGRGRLWASRHRHRGRLPEHGRAARIRVRGPVDGPRPRAPELSGTLGLDEQQERWSRQQRVPPHPLERHAEDHERVEEGPRDPGDHRHDRRFGHRGPHQRGPPREPPRIRRDEGPGHARRALDRDAPGVLEVLNQRLTDGPLNRFVPFSLLRHSLLDRASPIFRDTLPHLVRTHPQSVSTSVQRAAFQATISTPTACGRKMSRKRKGSRKPRSRKTLDPRVEDLRKKILHLDPYSGWFPAGATKRIMSIVDADLEPIGELETGSDGFVQLAVLVGRPFVRISYDPGQPYAALTWITLEK